jgi:hypothetical protein
MKRLIPSAFIAVGLLGGVGRAQNRVETRPYSEYRQNYSDQGTYHRSYGGWGLLGLCGLFGLLGARRGQTYVSTGRTYESGERIYEPTGRTYEPRPTH